MVQAGLCRRPASRQAGPGLRLAETGRGARGRAEGEGSQERGRSRPGTFWVVWATLPAWWAPQESAGDTGGGGTPSGVGAARGGQESG